MRTWMICAVLAACAAPPQESMEYQDLVCSYSHRMEYCNPVNGNAVCAAVCQSDSYCGICVWNPPSGSGKGRWTGPNGLASECPQLGAPKPGQSETVFVCQPGAPL